MIAWSPEGSDKGSGGKLLQRSQGQVTDGPKAGAGAGAGASARRGGTLR